MTRIPLEIEAAIQETRVYEAGRAAEMRVIVGLLRGGARVLGQRIEVVWPDGPPFGLSNEKLADWIERK